ncbi:dnaJ homolog subfamily C member 25 homolog isoform X3 [Ixodes scapularis]|uniref:J domain-containing protein n=1 Tax=Ixodes scapularis TaxID=6945 RepID=A0A4D5RP40_IXOSC|nr:dnaJ homolog subfamily C member 25 homolog isoform X3 [Ixodes scapularis]
MLVSERGVPILVLVAACVAGAHGFIDGLYCGRENCYEVLGVGRDTSKAEMARAYRQLARKHHPDMHKTQEAKSRATERFTLIATAYEILKDDESRKDYDDMLDNPEAVYRHYFRYYRKRMAPRVDVRIVLAVTITVISVVQYYGAWHRYRTAIDHLVTVPKYRLKAVEIARADGFYNPSRKRDRRRKEELKDEEESLLRKIIEEQVDIRGGYSRPSLRQVLWVQLVLLPVTLGHLAWWQARWLFKFTLGGQELGPVEKEYLIRRHMGLSQGQWDALEDRERQGFLRDQLWLKDKFKVWKQRQEEEMRAKLAESARYKSYRRYMKNHGPGQISFED